MKAELNLKLLYWALVFSLLFLPLTNSFVQILKKTLKVMIDNNEYNKTIGELEDENVKLTNKIKYYKTNSGLKTLIKDRLDKVEEGEVIIKYKNK